MFAEASCDGPGSGPGEDGGNSVVDKTICIGGGGGVPDPSFISACAVLTILLSITFEFGFRLLVAFALRGESKLGILAELETEVDFMWVREEWDCAGAVPKS